MGGDLMVRRNRSLRLGLLALAALLTLGLLGASGAEAAKGKKKGPQARIDWTEHHVPHITARNWEGLGYGYGYAFASDDICTLADQFVTVRAERSRWFGPDESSPDGHSNLNSDFYFEMVKQEGIVEKALKRKPPKGPSSAAKKLVRGYVQGYNKYLKQKGRDNLPDPRCRGEKWVRKIKPIDLWRRFHQLLILASADALLDEIAEAAPPAEEAKAPTPVPNKAEAIREALALPEIGSNMVGLGSDATANGRGLLLGNPHFPWTGSERFYQAQLRIPGKLNVSGASLFGMPMIAIGHTKGMAWSHTVSPASRFTLHQLKLVPGNPTAYTYDGKVEQMREVPVSVKALGDNGQLETRSHSFYMTRFGPAFALPGVLNWTGTTGYAFDDANGSHLRTPDQFRAMNLAQNVKQVRKAQDRWQGVPWVHTVAVDRKGRAYYADASIVPNVTDAQIDDCVSGIGELVLDVQGVALLDGSRSECSWGTDKDAVVKGIIGPKNLPHMVRRDYVQNSNDSYWLANAGAPIEGLSHSTILGGEREQQGLRTRYGIMNVESRIPGTAGYTGAPKFTPARLRQMDLSDEVLSAKLAQQGAAQMCQDVMPTVMVDGSPVDISDACPVLSDWDGHANLDSRGTALWLSFWSHTPAPWTTPFSANDPVNTPSGFDVNDPDVQEALGAAVQELGDRGIPLDARWGDVQMAPQADIPIHGCPGAAGCYNAIYSSTDDQNEALSRVGSGSSWIQVVGFGKKGVKAKNILTYSQSENPSSPYNSDQTELFSEKKFKQDYFTRKQVRKATVKTKRLR
jgi:acyl-homoserine-lactone acylase